MPIKNLPPRRRGAVRLHALAPAGRRRTAAAAASSIRRLQILLNRRSQHSKTTHRSVVRRRPAATSEASAICRRLTFLDDNKCSRRRPKVYSQDILNAHERETTLNSAAPRRYRDDCTDRNPSLNHFPQFPPLWPCSLSFWYQNHIHARVPRGHHVHQIW